MGSSPVFGGYSSEPNVGSGPTLGLIPLQVLKGHEFIFVRHSQMVFDELLEQYSSVVGHVIIGADKKLIDGLDGWEQSSVRLKGDGCSL